MSRCDHPEKLVEAESSSAFMQASQALPRASLPPPLSGGPSRASAKAGVLGPLHLCMPCKPIIKPVARACVPSPTTEQVEWSFNLGDDPDAAPPKSPLRSSLVLPACELRTYFQPPNADGSPAPPLTSLIGGPPAPAPVQRAPHPPEQQLQQHQQQPAAVAGRGRGRGKHKGKPGAAGPAGLAQPRAVAVAPSYSMAPAQPPHQQHLPPGIPPVVPMAHPVQPVYAAAPAPAPAAFAVLPPTPVVNEDMVSRCRRTAHARADLYSCFTCD
jgi:hypothetical protein